MRLEPTELELEHLVVDYLRSHGFTVVITGKYTKSQQAVNDPGCPDDLIHRNSWPDGMNLNLELKKLKGKVSTEQQLLADAGATIIKRIQLYDCIEQVMQEVERFEASVIAWAKSHTL